MHKMIKCNLTVNLSQNTGKAERKDLSIKPVLKSLEFSWQRRDQSQ